jgi:hypothetical protein
MDELVKPMYGGWNDDMWKKVIRSVIEHTILPIENLDDVVAGGWLLGQRRAQVLSREFQAAQDVPFALANWCWWPFKFEIFQGSWQYVSSRRWYVFKGAKENPEEVKERLIEVVPESVLRLDYHQLMGLLQAVHIRHILRLGKYNPAVVGSASQEEGDESEG